MDRPRIKLDEFVKTEYTTWATAHFKTHKFQLERITYSWSHLFGCYLDEIDQSKVEQYRNKRLGQTKPDILTTSAPGCRPDQNGAR